MPTTTRTYSPARSRRLAWPVAAFAALCCSLAAPALAQDPAPEAPMDVRDRRTRFGHWQLRLALRLGSPDSEYGGGGPPTLLFSGGYFVWHGLELSAGGAFGGEAELYGRVALYRRLAAVRLFAAGNVGYFRTGLGQGSGDFDLSTEGIRVAFDAGLHMAVPRAPTARVLVEPMFWLSYGLTQSLEDPDDSWDEHLTAALGVALIF